MLELVNELLWLESLLAWSFVGALRMGLVGDFVFFLFFAVFFLETVNPDFNVNVFL